MSFADDVKMVDIEKNDLFEEAAFRPLSAAQLFEPTEAQIYRDQLLSTGRFTILTEGCLMSQAARFSVVSRAFLSPCLVCSRNSTSRVQRKSILYTTRLSAVLQMCYSVSFNSDTRKQTYYPLSLNVI